MDYFVCIENSHYHYWQIELLIESFKYHQLEDSLCIAIIDNPSQKWAYPKNLINHKNKFITEKQEGHFCESKFKTLQYAIANRLIGDSFAVIHPYMVLLRPINKAFDSHVVFDIELENYKIRDSLKNYINKNNPDYFLKWVPVNNILIFNNITFNFFKDLQKNAERLREEIENVEKGVWGLTFCDYNGNISIEEYPFLEQTLLDHKKNNHFIHYKHGIPPEFSKYYYKYESPIFFVPSGMKPFEALWMNNISSSTDFVCKLLQNYELT